MVNAIILDLDLPRNTEEIDFAITYLRQLNFFHGIETIFVPKVVLDTITEFTSINQEKYLKELGQISRSDNELARDFEKKLNSILWQMKRTDIHEAQLSSLLSLYAIWLQAKRLKSLVIQSMSDPTSYFSRLIHLLAGEGREFIGPLANDIELWLFSHFADLYVEWPYFLRFPKEVTETFLKEDYFKRIQKQFIDFRTRTCVHPANELEMKKRARMISKMQRYFDWLLTLAKEKYGEEVIISKASLTVSNKTLTATERKALNYSELAEFFKETELINQNFVPCFIHVKFYPSKLLKPVEPYGLLPKSTNSLVYYHMFETAQEAELKLVFSKFRERMKINGPF
jgi:hypothetical protein